MRRLKILTIISLLFFVALSIRVFQKQVLEHKKYSDLAKAQQIVKKELAPKRGKIYVREGADLYPLATNLTFYSVSVVPKQIKDKKNTAIKLSSILNLNESELYDKINNDKPYLPPIASKVDEDKAEEIKNLNLAGVYLEEEDIRSYPEGEITASILGFVNAEGEGQYGLEGFYDSELRGEKGILLGEKDIGGKIINYLNKAVSSNGADLILTIDRTVQFEAANKIKEAVEKFKAVSGSILIMDPKTGAIIAMANYPTFDPNKYNEVKNYDLFQNSTIGKLWEPGSVFKVITMAAGIDSNVITKDTTEYFDASVKIGGYTIWTFDKKSHGRQTMTQVLETSNNVGAVYVAQKVGKELFYKYLKDFGFGSLTGIDLDTEVAKPLKPFKSWKDVELATMSFGQGIAVTPIQVVTAVSVIANGGKLVRPHIVDEIISPDGKRQKIEKKEIRQVISPSSAETVTSMMVSVVENGHGKKAKVAGYKVAGKTGTAQIPKKDGRGYEEGKSIGSFVGFAPAENPRFVMLVKIDEPQTVEWAESSAAPVFGEIAKFLLNYYQIPPSE
jgi:cell division protein FtsI/penicillin-binding protein 2